VVKDSLLEATMTEPVTKTLFVKCPAKKLFDFLVKAENWPRWAVHNVLAVQSGSDGWWLMDTPRGPGRLRIRPDERTGVLDHEFIDAQEGRWSVPTRVVAVSEGALLLMTFPKPDALPDEVFHLGMRLLDEELEMLKRLLESSEPLPTTARVAHAEQSPGIGGFKRVRVKEGQSASFESMFGELQSKVRQNESGTVYYDLFRSRTDPLVYFVLEKYESREAWEAHQHSPHGKVLFPQMRAILEELAVEYFDEQGGV
jgi:quinol monooxygenase YgiN